MCKKIEPVPCPVCGKEPLVVNGFDFYEIICNKIGCDNTVLMIGRTRLDAARRWNRWARKEARRLKGASK